MLDRWTTARRCGCRPGRNRRGGVETELDDADAHGSARLARSSLFPMRVCFPFAGWCHAGVPPCYLLAFYPDGAGL